MLRILGRTVQELWRAKPGDATAIHLHHIDLRREEIRREFTTRLGQSAFDPAITNDIAGSGNAPGLAAELDAQHFKGLSPYASYVARTAFVHSIAFNNDLRGIEPDHLRFSMLAPTLDLTFIDDARTKFRAESAYLDDRPGAPLRFNVDANLTQLIDALRRTLEKRLAQATTAAPLVSDGISPEDIADQIELGEDIDLDDAAALDREALAIEERADIAELLAAVARLPVDTKAVQLVEQLRELRERGYDQAIVFTQFTDTLDFLREHLARSAGFKVMCFSGRGGEVPRGADGWVQISREEVKRRFREGQAEILICTDAAAEGLNFQYCGALLNYDMPWNPMRVEQRIGRVDRLGQRFAEIQVINLHYRDTVESDVYLALRRRIRAFENVVGGLQPILSRLPSLIETAVLEARGDGGPASGQAAADQLERNIDTAGPSVEIENLTDQTLSMPKMTAPSLSLADLDLLLRDGPLPHGFEATPLGDSDFRLSSGALRRPARVTVDRALFDEHSDSIEFWTHGNPTFPRDLS